MTHYDVLGVPQTASFEQIKDAYRAQIKFFHPDVFPGNPEIAKIKTLQLNEAYAILRNPDTRAQYDLSIRSRERVTPPPEPERQPDPPPPPKPQKTKHRFRFNSLSFYALAIILLCYGPIAFDAIPSFFSDNTPPNKTTVSSPDANLFATIPPKNGNIIYSKFSNENRIAPFSIDTSGSGYYYVKLRDHQTGQTVLSFFVHGGQSVEIDVPLGNFDLLYAHGDIWYGPVNLFGQETVCQKADDPFLFYQDGEYVSGWTVELYPQTNGNLDMDYISMDEF